MKISLLPGLGWAVFGAVLASLPLRALEWEKTAIAVTIPVGTPEVAVKYPFKNKTAKPVHLIEISTSCGCTVASAQSNDVAPGATGAIDAVFSAGDHLGRQNKKIYVLTDESPEPVELALEVMIGAPQANERK